MKVCKFCRQEIVEGWETHYGKKIAEWMHKSGPYTCRYNPENLAAPADELWENVTARVGDPQGYVYDDEDNADVSQYTEFLIEVRTAETVWYSKFVVEKSELAELIDGAGGYRFILDQMVAQIDDYLTGRRTE